MALGCVLFFATMAVFRQPAVNEPVYQGRSFDLWLRDLLSPSTHDKAAFAICNMKPSPVPFLLERLARSGSGKRRRRAGINCAWTGS